MLIFNAYKKIIQKEKVLEIGCTTSCLQLTILYCTLRSFLRGRLHVLFFYHNKFFFVKPLKPNNIQNNWIINVKRTYSMNFVYSVEQSNLVILLFSKFWKYFGGGKKDDNDGLLSSLRHFKFHMHLSELCMETTQKYCVTS